MNRSRFELIEADVVGLGNDDLLKLLFAIGEEAKGRGLVTIDIDGTESPVKPSSDPLTRSAMPDCYHRQAAESLREHRIKVLAWIGAVFLSGLFWLAIYFMAIGCRNFVEGTSQTAAKLIVAKENP